MEPFELRCYAVKYNSESWFRGRFFGSLFSTLSAYCYEKCEHLISAGRPELSAQKGLMDNDKIDLELVYDCVCVHVSVFLPAFFGVLVPLVVELEGNLSIQANAKVVVHDALLGTLPGVREEGRRIS